MPALKVHTFDGEQLTVAEICARVPALSEANVRSALKAGRNTKMAMLTFDPKAASLAGARRGRENRVKQPFTVGIMRKP